MTPEETVLDVLATASEPLKSGEIAEAASLDPKVVAKAIKTLKAAEKITSPKRCYYAAQ